jgi:hypothetical protein
MRRTEVNIDSEAWMRRCCSRLILRDVEMSEVDALLLAEDMCADCGWRAMTPEDAADALHLLDSSLPPD